MPTIPARLPWAGLALAAAAAVALGALALAWQADQRAQALEAELGRRQHESAQAAQEARLLARQAEAAARDVVARIALLDARVAESAMQRSQIEDLLQSLARSRDENVLADVEAALRVAQQQAAITGSAEPLLQVLRQTGERLARYSQPRLERVRRAVAQDLERTKAAGVTDIPALAIRLDELVRQIDELPLLVTPPQAVGLRRVAAGGAASAATAINATSATATSAPGAAAARSGVAPLAPAQPPASAAPAGAPSASAAGARAGEAPGVPLLGALREGWRQLVAHVWAETRALVRITRIEAPEAMLIAPEQAWYLRENLKLRLLNARLALLSRQFETAQSDLREAQTTIERYFDRSARPTALATEALRQVAAQARTVAVPRPDATLAAIAAAAAGR
ncbi:MAG: uroporphyrinogen-III C-methyltransferase [Rubrivivax sp.]|nr:uroporphyrinogen-III C-methyltransferase [Rubrivivax sp.]